MKMLGHKLQLQQRGYCSVFQCSLWKAFDHPPYNREWLSLIFHLFLHMKWWMGRHFDTDNELQTNVVNWLKAQLFEIIGKSVQCYKKYLLQSCNYIEK
jgi:hypothetical protein